MNRDIVNEQAFFQVLSSSDLWLELKKHMYPGKKTSSIDSYRDGDIAARYGYLSLIKENKLPDGNVIIEQAKLIKPIFPAGTPPWYSRFSVEAASLLNAALKGDMTVQDALNKLAAKAEEVQTSQ